MSQRGRFWHPPHWPCLPMDVPGRRYLCARCRIAVLICSHCDRGNRYCTPSCAKAARQRAQREAAARYQQSLRGRHAHAARQRRYRARTQKVTHQGSPPTRAPAQLARQPTTHAVIRMPWCCERCHHALPDWVRQDFLRQRIRRTQPDRRSRGTDPGN